MFFINLALSLHILTRRAPSETPRARLISAWLMPRSYIISKSSRSFSPRGRVSSQAGQSSPDSLRRDSAISSNISSRLRLEAFRRASFIFFIRNGEEPASQIAVLQLAEPLPQQQEYLLRRVGRLPLVAET